jgi:hypothetical protein
MKNLMEFDNHLQSLKEKKWISGAIKKEGALRKEMGVEGEETLTKGDVDKMITQLKKKDQDKSEPGVQGLSKKDLKTYRRANLAKTLMGLGESHDEKENYMFFANVSNIHRMCEEILNMDSSFVDEVLSQGHGWAVDHISTSKDDVEEVYQFLNSEKKPQEIIIDKNSY